MVGMHVMSQHMAAKWVAKEKQGQKGLMEGLEIQIETKYNF